MTQEQINAFNTASGTTVSEAFTLIVTILFVMTIIWAVIMIYGKMQHLIKAHDLNIPQMISVGLRVLAVCVFVLILVHA